MAEDFVWFTEKYQDVLERAKVLGFSRLVLVHAQNQHFRSIQAIPGLVTEPAGYISAVAQAQKISKNHDIIIGPAQRDVLESKKVTHAMISESDLRKDGFFQKRSEFDDATCALAKKNNVIIVFDISDLGTVKMGRIVQDLRLCIKHDLRFMLASMAKNPYQLRSFKDMSGLLRILRSKAQC